MQYWLFKSEPFKFSWDDLIAAQDEPWDGIRNYQARNFMRQMQVGNLGFFYHSNEGLEVVGIVEVTKLAYPDHTFEPKQNAKGVFVNPWEMVNVRPVCAVKKKVSLADVKKNSALSDMALVTSMRLSVQPVKPEEWHEVLRMAETPDPK